MKSHGSGKGRLVRLPGWYVAQVKRRQARRLAPEASYELPPSTLEAEYGGDGDDAAKNGSGGDGDDDSKDGSGGDGDEPGDVVVGEKEKNPPHTGDVGHSGQHGGDGLLGTPGHAGHQGPPRTGDVGHSGQQGDDGLLGTPGHAGHQGPPSSTPLHLQTRPPTLDISPWFVCAW